MRYVIWCIAWFSVLIIAWCGTSSKVDKFLTSYSDEDVIQKPVSGLESTTNSVSEQLLLDGTSTDTDIGYGSYTDFSDEQLQTALQNKKRVVLISYDVSCDNCVQLDESVNTSLSRLPSDVVVMKISFAQAQSLYKAKEQNSVIYLNSDGTVKYLSDGGIMSIDNLVYYL